MWWLWFLVPMVAILVWLVYEWYQHTFVQYTSTVVECQKMKKNEELRLCLISDLHNNRKNLHKLTQHILEFHPQAILLAGDLIDKHKSRNIHAEQFLTALVELSIPVFYSMGNHELSLAQKHPEAWKNYLSTLPKQIHFLDNSSALLEGSQRLCITGLSLPKEFYKKGSLYDNSKELPNINIPKHDFHVLMAHHPEYAQLYEVYHADLIVSGHLHGGLLRLPWIGGVLSPRLRLPDCDAGLLELQNNSKLFVSRGLGSHTIPLRFFNRVEVNFLTLKRK